MAMRPPGMSAVPSAPVAEMVEENGLEAKVWGTLDRQSKVLLQVDYHCQHRQWVEVLESAAALDQRGREYSGLRKN